MPNVETDTFWSCPKWLPAPVTLSVLAFGYKMSGKNVHGPNYANEIPKLKSIKNGN
jgi:hypothetical protein